MKYVLPFAAGFVATLLFHQGLIALLHAFGVVPFGAWSMAATWPLGVPKVISLAFWAGLWGVVLAIPLRRRRGVQWWVGWALLGAIGPTAAALLVVFPLKGWTVTGGAIVLGALLNGFWGLGTALLLDASRRAVRALR